MTDQETTPERAVGACRVVGSLTEKKHAADGMTAIVHVGDDAVHTIINPQSFADGGPEWVMRYGNAESIRHTVASLLECYDYLLSGEITMADATRRLRLLRAARKELANARP